MGLPIPFLFFWESQDNGKLEIVDGSQRLRTIEQFILGGMKLVGDLTKLTSMQGLTFDDLPEARRRKIRNRSIRGIVLNEHADEEARFDLFERINTGSLMANKAEVRRGALSGPFLTLVIDLAKDPTLVQLAPISEAQVKLREREELVTRFFAYGDGLDGYQDRVSPFLFAYAKKMNEEFTKSPELVDEYRDRFHKTIGFISRVFPFGFRRTAKGKATPRSRFEAISVGVHRALSEKPDLEALNVDVKHWISGVAFQECVGSDGANAVARLKARIDFVRDKLVNQ